MSPGCYVMDLLRPTGCYRMRIRLFRDDPRLYTVRWFVVPDCTPPFPTWHRFGSSVWSCRPGAPSVGPGEIPELGKVWDRGLPPPEPNPFRGEIDWYQQGVPVAALP